MERPSYGSLAGDASQRVHSIISAAEAEAEALRREAEREAELIRRDAHDDGERILEEARGRADDLVRERMRRIAELSDQVVERTDLLLERMEGTGQVKRQLETLMRTLGDAAEAVAREASRPLPRREQPRREAPARREQPRRDAPAAREPSRREPPAARSGEGRGAAETGSAREAAPPPRPVRRIAQGSAGRAQGESQRSRPPSRQPEPDRISSEASQQAKGPSPQPAKEQPQAAKDQAQPGKERAQPPKAPPEPASAPIKAERVEKPAPPAADSQFDGARLVALQMAVAGSTREEVEAELQRAFQLPDPSPILDDVFGDSGSRRASA